MRRHLLPLALCAATLAAVAAAVVQLPGANGPEEWNWSYHPPGLEPGPAAVAVLAALAVIALLAAATGPPATSRYRLPLLLVLGFVFSLALAAAQPGGFKRVTGALVSRQSFGYVWDAASAPGSRQLLADYPAASASLHQHSLTHPPGPLLAVRALDLLTRGLPAPTAGLPALAGRSIQAEIGRARAHQRPFPDPPPQPWTVAALALLLPLLSAAAGWPLFGLALAWGLNRVTALYAVVLWLLVPARSLFTPSLDQALPLLLLGAAWLAGRAPAPRPAALTAEPLASWPAAAAGLLSWLACFLSYGCLAALPLVALSAVLGVPRTRPLLPRLAALAAGFLLPYLVLAVTAGHNPWTAFRVALGFHHRIAVAPRGYATWLLFDPYDFALLLSPVVLGLAAAGLRRRPTHRTVATEGEPWQVPPWRVALRAWWALLALLLLSGGVRGEAGRIWLLWMPFACIFAAAALAERQTEPAAGSAVSYALPACAALLALALAASMTFVS
ncbi:MAG TPA: hypothetical protein VHR45_06220 [Thermoanaerobaculia bacterium]|nr:hypothetical protein [Thermoanaerobaculia bacterium]